MNRAFWVRVLLMIVFASLMNGWRDLSTEHPFWSGFCICAAFSVVTLDAARLGRP
jgi:hypothetical protein